MTIFLGYTTALRYWHSMRAHNRYGIPMERSSAQPAVVPSPAEERAAEEAAARAQFCPHDEPLHVVVGVASARLRASDAVYHVKSCVFPRRSFVAVQEGVFISSPELCFLQMAEELELPDLVQFGFELCGSYGMRDQDGPIGKSEVGLGFARRVGKAVSWFDTDYEMAAGREEGAGSAGYLSCVLLVSVASLERFIGRCGGQYGVKKAREALRYVADNAASPMEAKLVALLCLPRIKGGYGLPLPVLNKRRNPRSERGWRAKKEFYRCDLSWGHVVVEYDSREWHSGKDKLEEDAVRRNDLAYMGAFVISVTTGQLYSRLDMDKVVALLRRRLGIKVKDPRYDYVSRQRKLRWNLLRTRR